MGLIGNRAKELDIYRNTLMKAHSYLSLRGVDVRDSDSTGNQMRRELNQVYVALDTRTHIDLTKTEKKELEKLTVTDTIKPVLFPLWKRSPPIVVWLFWVIPVPGNPLL